MKMGIIGKILASTSVSLTMPITAYAQSASGNDEMGSGQAESANSEIIVTANKREQSINDVGLTIQAATAEALTNRGIDEVADLSKLVAGFTATQSTFVTPVYTLRGIGLYDATVGAAPAVAIYTDQVPRNFPVMSDALELDIERIEVLKGPQGTLFGQSSTGGAINYIVGKPTSTFEAGLNASYERFNLADVSGFISGPISGSLNARLALRGISGGAWQRSVTRPDDVNGDTRKVMGRLSLDWQPTDRLVVQASITGARDRSDVQAPQYAGAFYNIYSAASLAAANANPATANPFGVVNEDLYAQFTTPGSPGFRPSHLADQLTVVTRMNGVGTLNLVRPEVAAGSMSILGTPVVENNRGADWTPGLLRGSRDHFIQGTLRADIDLSDIITLTSITAYAEKKFDRTVDLDGTAAVSTDVLTFGKLRTFNQEIRISGETDRFNWVIGANFDNIDIDDNNDYIILDYVTNDPLSAGITGLGPLEVTGARFGTKMKSYASFFSGDFQVTDSLTLSAGLRYTKNDQDASYCGLDSTGNQKTSQVFSILSQAIGGAPANFAVNPGQCFPLGDGTSGTTFGVSTLTPFTPELSEDNWSFRVGVDYKLQSGGLIYATISQGYKAGVFSNIGAATVAQFVPATQEKLLSYEAGLKLPLFQDNFQINASAFYYDYSDKQIRAKVFDPVFVLLERLINVPKSRVWGLEGEIVARPVEGLVITGNATYIDSKVTSSFDTFNGSSVFNNMGFTGDFKGSELPFTPNFMANADIEYSWELGDVRSFIGGTLVHQGSSNATFENEILRGDFFRLPSWQTVDLRAGFSSSDENWRFSIYGRNILNERVVSAANFYIDTYFFMLGRPAVYGASVSYRY